MPATPLPASNRFIQPGVTVVLLLPAVADISAPTRAEMDAGTDISDEIADWSGWNKQTTSVPTPSLGSRFTSSIPGRQTSEDSSFTVYGDKAGTDIRTVVTEDSEWFVMFMDGGDVATQVADVYPARCSSVSKVRNAAGDAALQVRTDFTITRPPAQDVTIPAAV